MKKTSGLAIASMVLGIVAICISFIPIVNQLVFIIGILAVIFGIVALIKRAGIGQAVAGLTTGAASIVISIVVITTITTGLNSVTKALDKVSSDLEEKQNKIHHVVYKVTSEQPVKVQYGNSKDRKEETVVGVWRKDGEFKGMDYTSLTTSPEDFLNFTGLTTCELIVDAESVSREEKSTGYVSCNAFGN